VATLAELEAEAARCTRCRLAQSRTKVVFGTGNPGASLLLVGEGPGRDEDLAGEPFVGRSGKLLDRLLAEELGIDRRHCYIANVVKCRPPNNRDPEPDEVAACRGFLEAQIELIAPRVVVALGAVATRTLLGTTKGVGALRGRCYPLGAAAVVPTYHPAAALRGGPELVAEMRADLVRAKQLLAGAADRVPRAAPAPAPGPAPASGPGPGGGLLL
jgi:uracil-DNA glycosylase family 4